MSASPSPTRRPTPSHRVPDVTHHVRRQPHGSRMAAPEGSATQTVTSDPPQSPGDGLVLRLRGAHEPSTTANSSVQNSTPTRRRIHWAEDVVDNEGLGRKKSKVCCIYHKAREVGESSSEDDSSSSSDSDGGGSSSGDDGAARPVGGGRKGRRRGRRGHRHHHGLGQGDGDGCGRGHDDVKRRPSPNAYERMPRYEVRPLERRPTTEGTKVGLETPGQEQELGECHPGA